ncbi:DUF2135 domain-containing protein [Paraliomyxa miuraensis]|uniref:DUF2135 domain-containing protein n=1 Tax=Paraliomyxa miuraensis TaxID=376150 RepID=UPI00224D2512|nr:DUF2135 domain-containing protein [Paraliomyxa miuraensis]MCX4245231.1 hypothetical protein [Paraliomyxa miuraensis]
MPSLRTLLSLAFLLLVLAPGPSGCSRNDDSAAAEAEPTRRADEKKEEAREDAAAPAAMEENKAKKDGGEDEDTKPETWKRSTLVANTSRLMIGDDESLPLQGMHVRARIDGFRARVLIDFFFLNPHDRQYEGNFELRLPSGASPWFLAFGQSAWESPAGPAKSPQYDERAQVRAQELMPDAIMRAREASWIEPKEARMVPRETAAVAYGATVRQRVDPALMEWAGAGVFDARIFPIAPNRLHRVVVGYDVDLTAVGDDLELRLPVPEGLPSSTVDLAISVPKGTTLEVTPTAELDAEGTRRFGRLTDVSGQEVTVRLGKAKGIALAGTDLSVGPIFAARVEPSLPVGTKGSAKAQGSPRAVLMVDTSLSANPDRFNVWLMLMRRLLEDDRGTIEQFAVVFFNVETAWFREEFVSNTPENVDALLEHAGTLALEGATDLGAALREASHPSWLGPVMGGGEELPPYDVFLLGDGAATWGEADAYALSEALRGGLAGSVFAYTTGMAGGDDAMLRHITRQTGGAVFSVVGESEVAAAATAHTSRPWLLQGVSLEGATDLLVAGRPRAVFPGQRLLVTGRGAPRPGAQLVLELSQGATTKRVSVPLPVVLESDLALRAYGELAVEQLEEFLDATETEAGAYARHFRVTGKSTSLLMLETEEDYQRFGIEPKRDGDTVIENPAATLVARALELLATRLGDPKAAFLGRLLRLAKTPGAMVALPKPLDTLLAALPRESYEVLVPPLRTKSRTRDGIPKPVLEQLAAQAPEYDTLTAEAERRHREVSPSDALKALSSLVEAQPGDGVLARDIGFSAMEWGLHGQAYGLFARVAAMRPHEPQTYRAMALTLAAMNRPELALAYFELGLGGQWDARFGEFQQILMQDYLRFLQGTTAAGLHPSLADYATHRAEVLRGRVDVAEADILVTITWNTDNTDVDLHVLEPSGEECFYSHPNTRSGGRLTRDVTQGYGPEMYVLAKAPPGQYRVRAKYFASDANRASARTKVHATITRNWGRANEEVETKVVTLETGKEMHELVTVDVRASP